MIRNLLPLAMLSVPAAAQDASPQLSLEQRMLLRCSAAFAIVAEGQANGNAQALQYPPMADRGREFFVRASARVMDEAGLDRAAVSAALATEARDISEDGTLEQVMPPCLALLPPA